MIVDRPTDWRALCDEELLMTYQHAVSAKVESIIQSTGTYAGMDDLAAATLAGLHAVLARWGRPAIEPVPVGERLPGPEDCDGCGNCWWFRQATRDDFPFWWFGDGDNTSTHWLPHHALPVPTILTKNN